MPRAGYKMKQLRHGVEKIDNLWDEEKQQSLGEMTKDCNHRKCHPTETDFDAMIISKLISGHTVTVLYKMPLYLK